MQQPQQPKRKADSDKNLIGYSPHGGLFGAVAEKKTKKETKSKVATKPVKKSVQPPIPTETTSAVITPVAPESNGKETSTPPPSPPLHAPLLEESKNDHKGEEDKEQEESSTSDGDDFHSADEAETTEKAEAEPVAPTEQEDDGEDEEWKQEQSNDLSKGNRLGAQRRLQRLICDYFSADKETGELIFLDDASSRVRGSDIRRLVNFFVPLKNIHPKAKPNGAAAVIEILRQRKLNYASLFPNETVKQLFAELANKPTAFQDKIKRLEQQRIQIKKIAKGLEQPNESATSTNDTAASDADWIAFA